METYDTPFDRAKALLAEFAEYAAANNHALPTRQYAQIGEVVRDCESVIASVGSLTPDPAYDPVTCLYPRSATFLLEVIRNCAFPAKRDGMTDHAKLEANSEAGAADGQLLYDFAGQLDGWSSKQNWSVVWSVAEANLQVASLQITIGIP